MSSLLLKHECFDLQPSNQLHTDKTTSSHRACVSKHTNKSAERLEHRCGNPTHVQLCRKHLDAHVHTCMQIKVNTKGLRERSVLPFFFISQYIIKQAHGRIVLWRWCVNIVCSSHCLPYIRLGESRASKYSQIFFVLFRLPTSTRMFCAHTSENTLNAEICKYTGADRQTDRTCSHDTKWLLIPCEAPFLPQAGNNTTTKTVTGNDRPCQQPYLSL